ncbi:hypothetical protein M1563_00435 [Patescibacteria group bacterium]|nr:hypothetical protein [Patescibacteria group bacterium]
MKESGFAPILLLAGVVAVGVLFAGGYYLDTQNIISLRSIVPAQLLPQATQSEQFSADQAARLIQNLPEVKNFLSTTQNGKVVLDNTSRAENFWRFHVYEDFSDHQSTFGWYDVDKTTGNVIKEAETISVPTD